MVSDMWFEYKMDTEGSAPIDTSAIAMVLHPAGFDTEIVQKTIFD